MQAISVIDFDSDGKLDLCFVGGSKVVLLQNNGEVLSETLLAGVSGAAIGCVGGLQWRRTSGPPAGNADGIEIVDESGQDDA